LKSRKAHSWPSCGPKMSSASEKPGLYVHVPFCRTKCPYCEFYSVTSIPLVQRWEEDLAMEIRASSEGWGIFDTLYVGGGTPSVLGERDLAMVFENLFREFRFSPEAEITVEANPDDIGLEKLRLLRSLGVTRISLGVQSLNETELRTLGRRHTAVQAETALETIRACGFANVSVDLIYGLPGQGREDWMETLNRVIDFSPEHLSCYELTYHEETPLGRSFAVGRVKPMDEEAQRNLFMTTAEAIEERGYLQYEVSNYARGEAFFSRHNRKYWRRAPYLGLGPGAHSFRDGMRWWNVRSVEEYHRLLAAGRRPVAGSETLTSDQARMEALFLGLRTREGVDLDTLRQSPGAGELLSRLQQERLVEVLGSRVVPTREGLVVADGLSGLFV
jgi:putative oxygen-independent coproporphyrinogen III oxidase